VGALSHVLERAGLATVGISLHHGHTRGLGPPRALLCHFPLGRPLGKPCDSVFQRRVLDAAFALLDARAGPALIEFPDVITDEADAPVACPLPPRVDATEPPAVSEAKGLRAAWDRANAAPSRTQVGRVVSADRVPEALARFVAIAEGDVWRAGTEDEGLLAAMAMDVRTYYEEAAVGLSDHVPAARAAETWFFQSTEAGRVLRKVREAIASANPNAEVLNYLVPLSQR
jgi:hypothetical protein